MTHDKLCEFLLTLDEIAERYGVFLSNGDVWDRETLSVLAKDVTFHNYGSRPYHDAEFTEEVK